MNFLIKAYQRPLNYVDSILDSVTSYRLVLYFLLTTVGWAMIISFRVGLPFSWHAILLSTFVLALVCRATGELFSRVLNISRNYESDYITALILVLILSPANNLREFAVLVGAGFAAIASKYLINISRQHIFNPAAVGALVAGVLFNHYASWWVGTVGLAPIVFVGGLLIMRKMNRFWMIMAFALPYGLILHQHFDGAPPLHTIWLAATGTGVMFFAFIMLTEPLTSPDALAKYLPFSVLIAILYSVNQLHISPEEALLIGNVFAFVFARNKHLRLGLAKIIKEAEGIYSFVFNYHGAMDFKAGQYMEWTVPVHPSDSRGNRRYMTLSSSPTENHLMFTMRLPNNASHFKQTVMAYKHSDTILASHLGGSFTLPKDPQRKLALIAGGIGVTPFRSMIKYLIDTKQSRQVELLYAADKADEFAFMDLFRQAKNFGVETKYLETSRHKISGRLVAKAIPDYHERLFYVSGPYGFVKIVQNELLDMGVSVKNIHSDYFPGYS